MSTTNMTTMTEEDDALSDQVGRIALSDDAPPVNLELLVFENKGLQVVPRPGLGRVTVATRDFASTELHVPILREMPAVICESNDYMDYMERFLDQDPEVQVGILDMFYQPLDSPMGQSLMEPAKVLFLLGVLDDFTLIHQLLSIYTTNAHQYQETKSALPIFGSKIPHSCCPNVGYSSQTEDGCVEYSLLKPIQRGEVVSFSYLSDLFETPTNERRQLLWQTKSFLCQCERCMGPDYCRYVHCPHCIGDSPIKGKRITIACEYNIENDLEAHWQCPSCRDDITSKILSVERSLNTTLQVMERTIKKQKNFNKASGYSPNVLRELIEDCSIKLSPVHHLTIKALRLLVTISTTNAYVHFKQAIMRGIPIESNRRVQSLFRTSVEAGFRLVAACECVAVGCPGCGPLVLGKEWNVDNENANKVKSDNCLFAHEPLYDRATPMRHVCDNLLQLQPQYWPSYAITLTRRYLPILKAKFGNVDEIATNIVLAWETMTCRDCGTLWMGKPQ